MYYWYSKNMHHSIICIHIILHLSKVNLFIFISCSSFLNNNHQYDVITTQQHSVSKGRFNGNDMSHRFHLKAITIKILTFPTLHLTWVFNMSITKQKITLWLLLTNKICAFCSHLCRKKLHIYSFISNLDACA